MRLGSLVIAGYALLSGPGAVAQSRSSAAKDPISGTWTGYMGPNESNRNNITVKLKLEGSAVSGTITGPPQPGKIKTGSFDAKTGVLKLDVAVQGQGNVGFEGMLAKGTIAGQVHLGGQTGVFRITRGAAEAAPPPLGAELDPIDDEFSATPLGWAARGGQKKMVEWLLERGANPKLPMERPWARPVEWARRYGHEDIARLLQP